MITDISWVEALIALHQMLPKCEEFISNPMTNAPEDDSARVGSRVCDRFIPDTIADAAKAVGLVVNFVPLDDWESLADREILQKIMPYPLGNTERIIVINEVSFYKNTGPFEMIGSDFDTFVDTHKDNYGECAIDGDVIILLPDRGLIVLFHHEGYHATINCRD